ncbi:MAG: hypothetical protein ACRBN8_36600 [Nannocystales bacterium]
MPRRLHAPGCLFAVLSLATPHVVHAEPVSTDPVAAPTEPSLDKPVDEPLDEPAEEPADDAPAAASDTAPAETNPDADRAEPEPEPEPEPDAEPEPADDAEPEPADDVELEGPEQDSEVDDAVAPSSSLPDRLPRLQRIGWYHVLGAFTLGTTAGVLAGLAEREEDKATRIASGYDGETGASLLYADRQETYERRLDRGQAFETSAIVIGAAAGVTAIVAITLFAVDAKRRPSTTARRTRIGPGSLEVSF